MDEVFKALADPTRRSLLDELFERDGQTLGELEQRLPMSRFGVMKHLKVLEQAGLVSTRRRGREKLHFLNPVPIRLVHDRWVSKYAEPWAATLAGLKQRIEEEVQMDTQTDIDTHASGKRPWTAAPTDKVFEIYIKTTPERLWQAITDDEQRRKYSFGVGVRSDWTPGSAIETFHPEAGVTIGEGEILEVDPPLLLVHSFRALWSDEVKGEGTSRVTWEIEPVGDSCRLTLTHDQLRENANSELYGGWPMILSGLKTLLETGQTLTTPGSLRYSQAARPAT
ncbi:MAG: ArsR/SmtB family transcription factor [Solirubrobacteraceae bacterium]